MTILDDIEAKRQTALKKLDNLISDAVDNKNSATTTAARDHWQQVEDDLRDRESKVSAQIYENELQAAQSAFDALKKLTETLNAVAQHMTSATQLANKLADLTGAVTTAVDAMKKKS